MTLKTTPALLLTLFIGFTFSLMNPLYAQYCTGAFYTNSCNIGTNCYIKNVSIAGTTLNNTTGCTSITAVAWNIYPATGSTTGVLQQGVTYNFNVTTSASAIISLWLDYDKISSMVKFNEKYRSLFDKSDVIVPKPTYNW